MKKLLIVLFIIIPFSFAFALGDSYCCPFAEVFPVENNKATYSDVVQEDGVSASELYKRAKIWMVDAFKSSKDVIQNDDRENHIVIGKGFFKGNGHNGNIENAQYWFKIRIDCREGRYKYTLTDFIYDFDVVVLGTRSHVNEDFTRWGSIDFSYEYKKLLDEKFPPDKERNAKQQQKYEEYKSKLDKELSYKYEKAIEHYLLIDAQVKSLIGSLKHSMKQPNDDNW